MRLDGMTLYPTRSVVSYTPCVCGKDEFYLGFGRVTVDPDARGAIRLGERTSGVDDRPLYGVPFQCAGHSLTNAQFVVDDLGRGRLVAQLDGYVYSRPMKLRRS